MMIPINRPQIGAITPLQYMAGVRAYTARLMKNCPSPALKSMVAAMQNSVPVRPTPSRGAGVARTSNRPKPNTLQAAQTTLKHLKANREALLKSTKAALKTGSLAEAQAILAGIKRRTIAVRSKYRRKLDGIVLHIQR
jgi:hypothetical protein